MHGFETSALAASYRQQDNFVYLEPPSIWVTDFPSNTLSDLVQLPPGVRFGKVSVCGRFQYGDRYGHLSEYAFQLAVTEVTIVELPDIQ